MIIPKTAGYNPSDYDVYDLLNRRPFLYKVGPKFYIIGQDTFTESKDSFLNSQLEILQVAMEEDEKKSESLTGIISSLCFTNRVYENCETEFKALIDSLNDEELESLTEQMHNFVHLFNGNYCH